MKKTDFNPSTHIFLWDLHEVILEKNMRSWFSLCFRFNRKWELVRKLNKKSIVIFLTFALERLKIIKKQMVSEELVQAARTTGNDAFIELITIVCSAYTPIEDTVHLMQELSVLGYKHHLGSNIGQTVYDNSMTKFPTLFSMFEGNSIPFSTPDNSIVKKPHPDFFIAHTQKYNLKAEQLIFIDDKKANVESAQSIGMHGIQFKNAAQLRKQLIKYGILK